MTPLQHAADGGDLGVPGGPAPRSGRAAGRRPMARRPDRTSRPADAEPTPGTAPRRWRSMNADRPRLPHAPNPSSHPQQGAPGDGTSAIRSPDGGHPVPRALVAVADARRDAGRGARRVCGPDRRRPAPAAAASAHRPTRSRSTRSPRATEPDADIGPVTAGDDRDRVQVDDQRGQHGDERPAERQPRLRLLARGRGLSQFLRLDVHRRPARAPRRSSPRATRPTLERHAGITLARRPVPHLRAGRRLQAGRHAVQRPGRPGPGRGAAPAAARCRRPRRPPRSSPTSPRPTASTTPARTACPASPARSPTTSARSTPTSSATRCAPRTSRGHGGPNGYEWVDGGPVVLRHGGKCLSGDVDMDGVVEGAVGGDDYVIWQASADPAIARGLLQIPNLGPNRYAMTTVPPTGESWVQTTTLEGNHDWDTWLMEGSTGYDTEFVVAGEPFPFTIFGYVPGLTSKYQVPTGVAATYWQLPAHSFAAGGTGTIKGIVERRQGLRPRHRAAPACPARSGAASAARRSTEPIDGRWIALSDLGRGDTAVKLVRARRRRQLHDHRRARRHLHADLLGRGAEPHPRPRPGRRRRGRDRGPGHPPAHRLVHEDRRLRLQRHQPQRQARTPARPACRTSA